MRSRKLEVILLEVEKLEVESQEVGSHIARSGEVGSRKS